MKVFLPIFVITVALSSTGSGLTVQLNELYGELESPGYPETYKDNEDISWVITAQPGYQIVIYFTVFDLEDSFDDEMGGACVYDYVQVEDRGVNKRFCGNSKIYPSIAPKRWEKFRSENNTTTVRFVSDYSNDLEYSPPLGFKAHYVVQDKDECEEMRRLVQTTVEDWDELIYCNHFCVNVPGSYYCTCRSGFELHENQHTCKGSCNNVMITSDEGVILSPDYPAPYPRLTDCDWTIQVEEGKSLNIQFDTNFQIENHPEEQGCVYDWLKLQHLVSMVVNNQYACPGLYHVMANFVSAPVMQATHLNYHTFTLKNLIKVTLNEEEQFYCRDPPYNGSFVQTNLRKVKLELHTDNALEEAGFKMSYNTTRTRCLEPRDAPDNGMKNPNPKGFYEYGDEIMFECDPGYDLRPPLGSLLTCLNDGTWDRPAPTCQAKRCGPPTDLIAVRNSHIVNMETLNVNFKGRAIVACNEAYELISGEVEWRCSEDGVWVATSQNNGGNDIPVCSPICGMKNPGKLFTGFIAGGMPTEPYEWPWMAFIRFSATPYLAAGSGFCGGALVSEEYVLTAAHCLENQRSHDHVFIWLSAHDRSDDEETTTASLFGVSEVIRHPLFNSETLNYDYALLRMNVTVIMGRNLRPICIPSKPKHFNLLKPSNSYGWVAGWGRVVDFRISDILMHVLLPTVNNTVCWADFTRQARVHSINDFTSRYDGLTDKMFCAGDSSQSRGATCQGDSGGSFMQQDIRTRKYYTLGLVSFGVSKTPCGRSVSYTVFAKIDRSISNWIRGVISNPPS